MSNNKNEDYFEKLFEQLEAAFDEKKAKELVKQIKEIKSKNPNTYYSFIFDENGNLTAIKKDKETNGKDRK